MLRDIFTGRLFQGNLPSPSAKFMLRALRVARERGSRRIVNPCAGAFGFTRAAVAAGFEPANCRTGDIGLLSAILGYSMARRPLAELGIRYIDPALAPAQQFVGTPLEAGAALAALRACQCNRENYYARLLYEDIVKHWERASRDLQAQVDERIAYLGGLTFECADMWAQIEETLDDPEAVILLFPPAYKDGYSKMFPIEGRIEWNAPPVPQFDPDLQGRLFDMLRDARALAMWAWYYEAPPDVADRALFYEWSPARLIEQRLVANRPEGLPKAVHVKPVQRGAPSRFPLFAPGAVVTADTVVRFVRTKAEIALYYRDLFAHKLGITRAESYFLVLLDGHVFSVFGMFSDHLRRGESDTVNETFGFTVPSRVHARLNKLFMMLLVSGEAREFFESELGQPFRPVGSLQTTCIATYPELKVNRGILELRGREKMPDGRFKLDYFTRFDGRTFAEVVKAWLAKDGAVAPKGELIDG